MNNNNKQKQQQLSQMHMHISTKLNIHRDLGCSGVLYSPSLYRADWSITQVLLGPEPMRSAQCDCGSAVTSCSGKTNLWEFDSRFLLSSWWHTSAARWLKNECFQSESVHWVAGGETWHQLQHGHLEKKGLWTCTTTQVPQPELKSNNCSKEKK